MLHLLPSLQLLHLLNHLLLLLFRRQSLLFTCHLLLSTKTKQRSGCHLFCLAHLVLLPLCCCLPDFAPVSIISISISIIIIAQALQSALLKPTTTTFWTPLNSSLLFLALEFGSVWCCSDLSRTVGRRQVCATSAPDCEKIWRWPGCLLSFHLFLRSSVCYFYFYA